MGMVSIYKVIIADDRFYEREKLRSIINWELYGMQITGEAKNGREAFNLCLEQHPDIVITDIKMPLMNGIELARALCDALPATRIIFLSGYSDFNYARSAIELNVCSYLLKPYTETELCDALRRAVDIMSENTSKRSREERLLGLFSENLSTLREAFLYEVITSGASIAEKDFWSKSNMLGLRFEYDLFSMLRIDFHQGDCGSPNLRVLRAEIDSIIDKCMFSYSNSYFSLIEGFACYLLFNIDQNLSKGEIVKLLSSVSAALMGEFAKRKFTVSLKHSSQGYGYKSWNRIYAELGDHSQPSQLDNGNEMPEFIYRKYKEGEKELFDAVTHQQMEYACRFVDAIMDQAVSANLRACHLTKMCVSCYSEALRRIAQKNLLDGELDKLLALETPDQVSKWMQNILITAGKAVDMVKAGRNRLLIAKIREMIAARYAADIDVATISAELYISPNYLRQIFKEHTAKSLSGYITDYRIEKACELLRNTNYKISDIPQMVGLDNNPHFYFLVKKITGLTPSEYRMVENRQLAADTAQGEVG